MIKTDQEFNILAMGDISGDVGIETITKNIPIMKEKYKIDCVIANCENSAKHFGMTKREYKLIKQAGVDIITMGNHTFDKNGIFEILDNKDILIPGNWNPEMFPNKGSNVFEFDGVKVRVTNLLARTFMPQLVENPYLLLDKLTAKNDCDIHVVDFHGETSAEKIAMAYNYDGKISALLGTHTHIQSADNRILPKNTGYISDIGMNGPWNSVIGAEPKECIFREKTNMFAKLIPAKGPSQFCAVVLQFKGKKLKAIKRIFVSPQHNTFE